MWWWQGQEEPAPVPVPVPAPPSPTAEAPPAAAVPAEPEVQHPIEQVHPPSAGARQVATPLPPLDQSDQFVGQMLTGVLGRRAVQQFLRLDDVVRHVVTTVDNLPNTKASVRIWPVNPTPANLMVDGGGDSAVLSPSNSRRYLPFVRFVEELDTSEGVALYVELYPLFQGAYAELGYPNRYFNDRLIEVIDHLLDTPQVTGPIELFRPGVMYEYADPELEARSAGQKILIRMGSENAGRLKAKLREIRAQLSGAPVKE
jgi:hypothetical protein